MIILYIYVFIIFNDLFCLSLWQKNLGVNFGWKGVNFFEVRIKNRHQKEQNINQQ